MTGLGSRVGVLAATAAVVLTSGCGTAKVVQSQRADVTAAPPPDGNHVVVDTGKPHRRKHHPAARTRPGVWPTMHDRRSGISFALPTRSAAALDDYPAPGGGMTHSRSYTVNTRDDLTLRVMIQDTSSFKPEYLDLIAPATSQWLAAHGVTNIADAGNARRLTVGGRPAYEYGVVYDQPAGLGRGMMRVTAIAMPHHLVVAETFSLLGAERVLRQGHIIDVHARLMSHLRLA